MRFRYPDEKKMNALRLLPVFLLVFAVFFTAHQTYLYLTSAQDDTFMIIVGAMVMIYASVRSLYAVRRVFVWSDEEQQRDTAEDEDLSKPPGDAETGET